MNRCRGPFRSIRTLALCGAVCLAASVGCRSTRQAEPLDGLAGNYEKAKLEYKIDAGKLNVPIELARIEGQAVSYDHIGSMPLPEQATGTLTLEYPHPEKHIGFVKARLEIRSQDAAKLHAAETSTKKRWLWGTAWLRKSKPEPAADPEAVVEVWEVDVPRGELDQALAALNHQGYFKPDVEGRGGVDLCVKLGPREATKRWQQVAQLDALMLRARGHGRLVAYNRPHAQSSAPPSAMLAYQQWQQPAALAGAPQAMPAAAPQYAAAPAVAPYVAAAPPQPAATQVIGTPVPPPAPAQVATAPVASAYPTETPVPGTGGYAPGFAPAPAATSALPYGGTATAPAPAAQRRF